MSESDFLRLSTNTQIATGVTLIVILLMYIAYKLSESKPKRSASKHRRLAERV